ncbi:MAG: DNA translocase FtsK [Planctomycetota bacterium]|nr:MAG: DNA translocase FtsK [Planctomycetota bacterium]
MVDARSIRGDLTALALLALCVFLGMALWTYEPTDSLDGLVYPPPTKTANACGRAGAIAADLLLQGFGVGAYYLVVSLAVVDAWLLARRPVSQPILRAIGWAMSLVALCTLVSLTVSGWSPGPVVGPGGFVGAAGRGLLEMHFASAGAYILTISLLTGGMLLCTEYLLPQAAARGVAYGGRALRRARLAAALSAAERSADDEVRADLDEADESGLSVKIAGKPASRVQEAEDEEVEEEAYEAEEEEYEEEEEQQEEEYETDDTKAKKTVAWPRFKRPQKKSDREEVMKELDAASLTEDATAYELPPIDLLMPGEDICYEEHEKSVRRQAKILEKTFQDFGFQVKVVEIETGPVIAQFEVELEAGLRLSKITSLADDLAIALRVPSVRIVAPIPGKNTVGIEVPNTERHLVRLREVMEEADNRASKMRIPIYLGKDVSGKPMVVDMATMPHLLIAGRTGTGKSVCLNSIIVSMLMTRRPDEVRMLMIDPKMVELSPYKTLPHLMHPVVTDMRKAEAILAWAVEKMEERYTLLARAGVRHITGYNGLGESELMKRMQPEDDEERRNIPNTLPFIVIVADEIADLMMTAGKEVEQHIIRLAQKSRAVGIHLVLATQKPTVDVITGLIKSNLPARIAFQVASRTDSRVVLDEMGADKLLGNGDMLFLSPGTSMLLRGQGTYVSDDEINSIIARVGTSEPQFVKELVQLKVTDSSGAEGGGKKLPNRDDLYEGAVEVVVREGRGSVSLLQRTLGIGYGRAARLIDYMAEDGIVGQYNGSQARDVLVSPEQWEEMCGQGSTSAPEPPAPAAPSAPRSGRVLTVAARSEPQIEDDEEEEVDDDAYESDEDSEEEYEEEVEDELEDGEEYEEEEYEEEYEDDEEEVEDEEPSPTQFRRRGRESA